MNNQITTYYLPKNQNIQKGKIYTIYKSGINNLDLTPIITAKTLKIENLVSKKSDSSKITISKDDYTKLLELNNLSYQLSERRNQELQNFIKEQTKTAEEITKVSLERQELINKLTKGN